MTESSNEGSGPPTLDELYGSIDELDAENRELLEGARNWKSRYETWTRKIDSVIQIVGQVGDVVGELTRPNPDVAGIDPGETAEAAASSDEISAGVDRGDGNVPADVGEEKDPESWYYGWKGKRHGPVTEAALRDRFDRGELDGSALLWKKGWDGWSGAGETDFVGNVPPELPEAPPPLPGSVKDGERPIATNDDLGKPVCGKCESELPEGARFCHECGNAVESENPAHCHSCGHAVRKGAKFCAGCGEKI